MTTAALAPIANYQVLGADGTPVVGGHIYTFLAGTTTPLASYKDSAGMTANDNPIILDSRGSCSLWLIGEYKFIVTDANDSVLYTTDNIVGISPGLSGAITATAAEINLLDSNNNPSVYANGNVIVLKSSTGVQLIDEQPILDTYGNPVISIGSFNSNGVNSIQIVNAPTAGAPVITGAGATDVPITFASAGAGTTTIGQASGPTSINGSAYTFGASSFNLQTTTTFNQATGTRPVLSLINSGSTVNYSTITAALTTASPTYTFTGTDTNVNGLIQTKGTGAITLSSPTGTAPVKIQTGTTNGMAINVATPTATRTFTMPDSDLPRHFVNDGFTSYVIASSGAGTYSASALPTTSGGNSGFTLAYTPKNANNILNIEAFVNVGTATGTSSRAIAGLFIGAATNATAAAMSSQTGEVGALKVYQLTMRSQVTAGTTSSINITVRYGGTSGTGYINQDGSGNSLGGNMLSYIYVTEYTP